MRNQFDQQLSLLHQQLALMGALCENAIARAAKALCEGDPALARASAETEEQINQKEREIEALCLQLLLQQQPVARDLRQISAALKMITDLERIGDQAADIAELACTGPLGGWKAEQLEPIAQMARATIAMVTHSVDAFARRDMQLACQVIGEDDGVDALFSQVRQALAAQVQQQLLPAERALDLLMVAKYLERIGDHATNIAEWVVFSITGEHQGGEGF